MDPVFQMAIGLMVMNTDGRVFILAGEDWIKNENEQVAPQQLDCEPEDPNKPSKTLWEESEDFLDSEQPEGHKRDLETPQDTFSGEICFDYENGPGRVTWKGKELSK
ncbi:UNVERIFIED_CONTAM: hypothetical protein K2H54_059530 [Gekko kuhli]